MKKEFRKVEDDIHGRYVKIKNIPSIVNVTICERELVSLKSNNIEMWEQGCEWDVTSFANGIIGVSFDYKVSSFILNDEDLGERRYQGTLFIDVTNGASRVDLGGLTV